MLEYLESEEEELEKTDIYGEIMGIFSREPVSDLQSVIRKKPGVILRDLGYAEFEKDF